MFAFAEKKKTNDLFVLFSPLSGLFSLSTTFIRSILIRVATVGYAREPDFKVAAPDQLSQPERIAHMLKYHPVFREAAIKEGINPDKTPDMSQHQQRRREDRRRRKNSTHSQTKLIDPRLRVRAKL